MISPTLTRKDASEFAWVVVVIGLVTAIGFLLPFLTSESVGLLYLLAISLMSLRVGRWPMLLAGLLCGGLWEYLFVPPRFEFRLTSLQDILMVSIYLIVVLVLGQLADRIRTETQRQRRREESDRLQRTLLDSVSHELRTPLAVMTAALENLEGSGAARPLIEEMATAVRRLNRLVSNLLDQTRLESDALRPRLDWCDPADILRAATDGLKDALAPHPLTRAVPDDLPPVRADFALTEHALANLLLNAALHTPPGTPIAVGCGIDAPRGRAFFFVSDRGPGVPVAVRERLFQKFTRGDASRAGGLGLGLSIVRGFVAAQGGDIVLSDNPGGGSVFTIYLPHFPPQPDTPE